MGGLWKKMPITAFTMLVGVLAISGIPLFSGWYSKDAILASAIGFVVHHKEHALLFILPAVTAGVTTFYMFRLWFMTFAGQPRDRHLYEHAHESPGLMTTPLIALAVLSFCAGWGVNPGDVEGSWVEEQIHHAQPAAVDVDFVGAQFYARNYGHAAGYLVLGMVGVGLLFSILLYYSGTLDPAEAQEQFPTVHTFLSHKWYFDELYSAVAVRPALVFAHWFKAFDLWVIDGVLHFVAWLTVRVSRWDGIFDNRVVDGAVNLTGNVIRGIGVRLRGAQTGYLRSYVLFLVLAAVGIFIVITSLVL
jgi:NADH-quinone oxidoreductase subunit L